MVEQHLHHTMSYRRIRNATLVSSHPPVRIRPTAVATLATVLVVLAIYAGVAVLP